MDRLNMSLEDVIKSRKQTTQKPRRLPLRNKMQTMQKKRIRRMPQKISNQSKRIGKQVNVPKFKNIPRKSQYRQQREFTSRPMLRNQKIIYKPAPIRASTGKRILQVSGLQPNLTNQELFELFSKIGPLKRCQSKMTAIIGFELAVDARRAIQEYNGAELDEKKLRVQYAERGQKVQVQTGRKKMFYGGMRQQQYSMRTFRQNKMRRSQQQQTF